jgi:imidazolonepropionase-like amidohydrolase
VAERRRLAALLLALAAAACSPRAAPDAAPRPAARSEPPFALASVTVIDGRGGAPLRDRTVVVADGRIADIFPTGSRRLPASTTVYSLPGHVVIPGLIDSHVHLGTRPREPALVEALLRNALLGGVTTVRDMGGNGPIVAGLSARQRRGEIEAPAIVYATLVTGPYSAFWTEGDVGGFVAGDRPRGETPWWRRLRDERDVPALIRDARAFGAAGIKVHSGLSPALLAIVAREARRAGLHVWSHAAVTPALPQDAVAAGVEVLSHADMIAFAGLDHLPPVPRIEEYRAAAFAAATGTDPDGAAVTRLFEAMIRRGTILEPTLFIIDAPPNIDAAGRARLAAAQRFAFAVTRRANALGVAVSAGTDSIGGSSPNLHAELQLLVQAGLTPLQAITAATATAARAAGVERDRGLLARGLRADLVILCRDPSSDIRNTLAVLAVVHDGRILLRSGAVPTPPRAQAAAGGACPAPPDRAWRGRFGGAG